MKGLTHFMTGVCIATFFPLVVTAAYTQDLIMLTLLIPIGGLFGYLPDFLDFKLSRYLEREDFSTNPGYHELDPWRVAQTIVDSINKAYESDKAIKLKLNTIKMPNGLWRRYSVLFKLKEREVHVRIGPLITTGLEVLYGTEPEQEKVAVVKFKPKLYYSYEDVTNVDIWDGPTFQFRREGDTIFADFIQWHRRWSHSLTIGVFFAFFIALAAGYLYSINGVLLSDLEVLTIIGIILGGVWGHVIVDQLGWLGSNLFWPITGKRKTGMGLTRSMDSLANFITTYILTLLIIWNLNRFAPTPVFPWNDFEFFMMFLVLPIAVTVAGVTVYRKKQLVKEMKSRGAEEMEEVAMEIAEF